ncbi:probable LRR receptor-like serine/threonine-protein kinase At3g47570 [Juglans regia]|uniref:Probable LRR receptor-like serine/threonine-protein kinase At3g47570 n=2 Tax=Juglans regia TaxID=51240 RepID=A0A2I4FEE0_JUGRE|nr:probable LRR receptor-like serine/threonine-protein kinase At3g47570 [Juglans regia]
MVLNLSFMGLVGTIPLHIGNLSFLVSLSIANNSFHGSIPIELSHLTRLKFFDFGYNEFNGAIPSQMGSLTKLRKLYLNENNFIGTIPPSLSNISSLQVIALGYNQLSGTIPSSIFKLSSLQEIYLGANKLSGPISSIFFSISSLQIIELGNNMLYGGLSTYMFDHLPNLQYLSIYRNQLSGELPKIENLTMLTELYLDDNNFEGRLPPEIGNLTMLMELYLSYNNFEDEEMVAHVADFGMAKLLDDRDSLMQTMTLATFRYMAPEYGLEGVVSTRGDVYSYGILLMETFTRKRPTDGMFIGEMTLKHWVDESLLTSILNIVDANLLRNEKEHTAMEDCISSVMRLALDCCAESPTQRIYIKNVSATLNKVKLKFVLDGRRS